MKEIDELDKTNVEIIDEQHGKLTAIINNYITSDDASREGFDRFCEELSAGAKEHFATEENLMLQRRYENYYSHRQEHERFLRKVNSFSFDNRTALIEFARDWLSSHLKLKDMRLAQFLIETSSSNKT